MKGRRAVLPQSERRIKMGQLFDPKYGPVVGIGPFYVANLDTAQTHADLAIGQSGMTLTPGMPSTGTVVGLSVNASAAPSAGTAIFSVHLAGTEYSGTPTATIDSATNTLESSGLCDSARKITFAKGARLGISVTTTTTLAATTVDYNATLWVRFDPDGTALT
jgi:hypothetical protein